MGKKYRRGGIFKRITVKLRINSFNLLKKLENMPAPGSLCAQIGFVVFI